MEDYKTRSPYVGAVLSALLLSALIIVQHLDIFVLIDRGVGRDIKSSGRGFVAPRCPRPAASMFFPVVSACLGDRNPKNSLGQLISLRFSESFGQPIVFCRQDAYHGKLES